jgi:hypothetical protein
MTHSLAFHSTTKFNPSDTIKLELIRKELREMRDREDRRHLMDSTPGLDTCLDELIDCLTEFLDWEPSDADMDPTPVTANETHSAAWKEHQEAHS